jgi:hypothetical protein
VNNGYDPDLFVVGLTNMNPTPDIVFDGCHDAAKGDGTGELANCLSNNGAATFMAPACSNAMILPSDPPNTDITTVTCTHDPLPSEPPT